ncbi:LOW QUALITY PROTEIN: protein NETWORKED 2D-like [Durio zibethinus]|uniref:LOW QUALITY PROTEIN: protein NETWORKED 2D-like n=1 Tax=Durio zibethinus TaxID=66656 RepID=A0A6P6BD63_DURZI|nr:LOW QUALITY PROTEIN: protein NETWORKED 2D-like [Durio zibethinus]
MLQRAASNAYSWWWASHIRTKQSKWMEQHLQDMEEKVANVLKLIQEDGDSFARRAEMYYKKRPELIHFVEESYRAYRALAERYDHISKELQNANNTIASVCPEQVQFAMGDEDEYGSPRFPKKFSENSKGNSPKVPELPVKDLEGLIKSATKKMQHKKSTKATMTAVPKSGLNKAEGLEEIDRLQKRILAFQTEKEFIKSSYESGMAKYWEIDNEIKEMQEKVCSLEDEFGEVRFIEDDEARNVMAATALKSCKETLAQLQEKQERSVMEAEVEQKRIKDASKKLDSLKNKFLLNQVSQEKPSAGDESVIAVEKSKRLEQVSDTTQKRKDMESLRNKIKEHFEVSLGESLTMTEMAEKIDELVNKVIHLETAVSSQTALILRLRTEIDELQAQILTLEADKATLVDGKNDLRNKLREMEEKLHGIQDLNQSVEDQNNNLQTHFTEAHCNLDHLSEKVQTVKPDEELEREKSSSLEVKSSKEITDLNEKPKKVKAGKEFEVTDASEREKSPDEVKSQKESEEQEIRSTDPSDSCKNLQCAKPEEMVVASGSLQKEEDYLVKVESPKKSEEKGEKLDGFPKGGDVKLGGREDPEEHDSVTTSTNGGVSHETYKPSENCEDLIAEDKVDQQTSSQIADILAKVESKEQERGQQDEPDWKQLFLKGMEDREKHLLMEYTTMFRSYMDTKKKLMEVETNNQNSLFEITLQLKELKSNNTMKDEEIRSLRQKLSLLQAGLGENNNTDQYVEPRVSSEKSIVTETETTASSEKVKEDIRVMLINHCQTTSAIEEKFRINIDELLEENLDFWFRFSTALHEVKKFETGVKDLDAEVSKLEERQNQGGCSSAKYSLKSDARPLYKHLREVQNELTVWVEKSLLLREELKNRFSSLCDIQEEITKALNASAEDNDFKFTSYQAAKLQGEILNMKQENNKLQMNLQAGLDLVITLQLEVERTLAKLTEDWGLSGSSGSKSRQSSQPQNSDSRSGVPLSSFIFGVKPKKQRTSIFSCVHPALYRKYNGLRSGRSSSR